MKLKNKKKWSKLGSFNFVRIYNWGKLNPPGNHRFNKSKGGGGWGPKPPNMYMPLNSKPTDFGIPN